ncbi:hypothetical protein LTR17_020740 [Elasticomyces elasticus]|nr:hypothetical protein LTR17_020740 [Elasticomyces elasticus]
MSNQIGYYRRGQNESFHLFSPHPMTDTAWGFSARIEPYQKIATVAWVALFASVGWALYKGLTGPLCSIPGPWYTKFTVLKYKTLTGQRIFYIHELYQRHGSVVRIDTQEVNVCDVDAYAAVHRIECRFTKSDWYDRATPGIEGNVFVMTNVSEHAARRRLLARPFSRSSLLMNFEFLIVDRARLAVENIRREAGLDDCDMMKWWTLMATDVIAQKTEYINDLENVLQAWALRGEAPALYHMMRIAAPKLMRSFKLSLKNVVDYGTSTAARARRDEVKRENVISGMLANAQSDNTTLSDSALGAQASALIVAGSGTTATTLTYAVWAIMSHADVRNKLEQEVLSLPEDYTDALLEKLPYLKAVILETLRLYGAAPGSLSRVTPSKGMQVKDFFVPAGTIMTTQAYTMHRDAAVFSDPEK